jgi:hypothetical protein
MKKSFVSIAIALSVLVSFLSCETALGSKICSQYIKSPRCIWKIERFPNLEPQNRQLPPYLNNISEL